MSAYKVPARLVATSTRLNPHYNLARSIQVGKRAPRIDPDGNTKKNWMCRGRCSSSILEQPRASGEVISTSTNKRRPCLTRAGFIKSHPRRAAHFLQPE